MASDCSGHLHFELKVFVLPLPAQEIARNADPDGLPEGAAARPQRTRDQTLEGKRREEEEDGEKQVKSETAGCDGGGCSNKGEKKSSAFISFIIVSMET